MPPTETESEMADSTSIRDNTDELLRILESDMFCETEMQSSRLLYPIEEAIAQLGIGRTFLYELMKHGQVQPVKIGRRTLIPHDELVRYVGSLPRGTTDE